MTDDEMEILDLLAVVWNKYLDLEQQLPNDRIEFMQIIHQAERMLLCRDALRKIWKEEIEK